MTHINRIVMHGFKSFANRTELLFGNNFNVVLGPNGSGKSNVLDALCFVLGKSSSKSLRAEKSSNLIYNGGKSKNPAKFGEVSIFFDNSSKKFPTEDKDVKLTRRVRGNGQSIYKINDRTRTRQQVLELMSHAKINPDGYNIILQGDIVRFTEMPSVERRQLIEEVSGISIYEEKKNKALRELERVDERMKEADIILGERKIHLKELKKDRDEALKYKELNDRIKQDEASYLKIQIDKKDDEKNSIEKSMKQIQAELGDITKKIEEMVKKKEELRQNIEDITKDIEEKGEIEQLKLSKDIENLKIDLTKKTGRIDTCRAELEKLVKRRDDLKESIKEQKKKIADFDAEKKKIEKKIYDISKNSEDLKKRIESFKEKNEIDDVGEIEKEIGEIDKKSEEIQKKIHSLREEEHNLLRQKDRIEHNISTVDEKISKVKQVEKEHYEQINGLRKKKEDFKKTILELNKLLNEDSSFAIELDKKKKKNNHADEELAKLQARNIGIRENISANDAVDEILKQKGKIGGIYGTVAQLGEVSSKYSIALEVAAGPRLKSIIVENDKVASECIKHLKKNKTGTATLLPLNKLKTSALKPEAVELSSANGSYGMALDLISYDSKYKKAFEYIFANTVVVDNIDVARRLGIGKAKMVTLDGDLCEVSGVMHGGFMKKKGFGFSEKEINKDIEEYEEILSNLKKSISSLEKAREENEAKIAELRNKKSNLEGDIIKTEKSLHLESGDIELSLKQKDEFKKEMENALKGISEIKKKIDETNKGFTEIKVKKAELRSRITNLSNPALIAELKTYEEKKNEYSQELIRLNSDIKNIHSQTESVYKPEIEKTNQILKQIDREEENFNRELNELLNKIKEQGDLLKQKEKAEKEFRSRFKDLFNTRNRINEEINKNDIIMNKKNEQSKQVEIRLNTFSLKNAEVVARLSALNQEFEQYHGVKIDTSKSEEALKDDIAKFRRIKENIGNVNMRALEVYEQVEKEYNSLFEKKEKLQVEKDDVMKMINEIELKKKDLFMGTFNVTNENFQKIFRLLSTKGEAYLDIENEENPFAEGINIKVRLTGNKFLDIRGLSGGEKTLTALAFIFAIQEHEPASFYVLDEVDAALDKHNSEKFGKLIAKYAENAQYIIISHNDHVISEAENLYGVSMNEHGITNVVSLKV